MIDSKIDLAYAKSAYGVGTDSNSLEEERKPCGRDCKKYQHFKSRQGCKKKKKNKDDKHKKNTCSHCKKFHHRKPHRINPDKFLWNKKYNCYHFKSKCNEIRHSNHTTNFLQSKAGMQ